MKQFLLLVCCVQLAGGSSFADEEQLRDVLDAWERGCDAIWSYDLHLSAQGEWYDAQGAVRARMDTPSRQVFKRGKRRLERLPGRDGNARPLQIHVWDGELAKTFGAVAKQVVIRAQLMSTAPGVPASDYETSYRDVGYHTPFLETIRERAGTKLSYEGSSVVLYTPPVAGKMYSPYGLRVWLAPEKNFLAVRCQALRDNSGTEYIAFEKEVTLAEVAPDLWAPVKWAFINFPLTLPRPGEAPPRRSGISTMTVDLAVSKFNFDVPESEFTIEVPAGTEVFDEIQDIDYTYGEADNPAAHLSELVLSGRAAANELKERRLEQSPAVERHSTRLYVLFAANALVAVGAVLYTFLLRARKNTRH